MHIGNLASYPGLVTYGLAPVGLALQLFGNYNQPQVNGENGKGGQDQRNPPKVNDLAIKGKTIQQVAAALLLIKTGLDYGLAEDYVVASAAGVGAAAIFAGGVFESKLKDWGMTHSHHKMFSTGVDLGVLAINLINILVVNGSNHIKIGSFPQQIWVGTSMVATTLLTIAVSKA